MGCSNSPSTKTHKPHNYFHLKSKEIENLRMQVESKEEKLFLDVYHNAKSDEEVRFKNLILSQDIYFELLGILKTNQKIESLICSNLLFQGLTDVIPQLYHVLKGKKTIKRLQFEYITNMGNKKGKALFRLSTELPSLESLILKEIDLEPEDAEFLGLLIAKSSERLTYLEIVSIYFFDRTNYLLDGFNVNNSIKELILNKLDLDAKNFEFLISSLVSNYCLSTLDVSNNPIGPGTEAIKKYPLVNLVILIMNNCSINSDDLSNLCEGLEKNKMLKTVELNHNKIDNSAIGVKGIEKLFKANETIQIFSLKNNKITKVDIEEYVEDIAFQKILLDDFDPFQ